jgi:hypothetical protein
MKGRKGEGEKGRKGEREKRRLIIRRRFLCDLCVDFASFAVNGF